MLAPRIAIVGGGPGGLVLLNVLARRNIRATLYERDAEFGSRAHIGGTLDLHEDSGQEAMHGAGAWDAFMQHSHPEGENKFITDKTGVTLFHHAPPPNAAKPSRPEIDRTVLRRILVDAAPPGSIKFGHAFVAAKPVAGSAQWEVAFANGHTEVVDLLVGADGARSRVRPLVSDAQIAYTGVSGAEVSIAPEVAAAQPELMARLGNGSALAVTIALDENKMIAAARNIDGRVRTYAWYPSEKEDVLPAEPAQAVAHILSHFDGWAPWLRQLIELADHQAIYARPLYQLPVGHSWPHRAGVTLLGDAMNLMAPAAGRGANVAMKAGLELGVAIAAVRAGTLADLDAAVAKYEEEVGKFAAISTAETERNLKAMMAPNAAQAMAKAFSRAGAPREQPEE